MNNLDRRIERLEDKLGAKAEPRVMVMTNVAPREGEESPYCAKVAPDRWAHAIRGGPFSGEEIHKVSEEYRGVGYGQI